MIATKCYVVEALRPRSFAWRNPGSAMGDIDFETAEATVNRLVVTRNGATFVADAENKRELAMMATNMSLQRIMYKIQRLSKDSLTLCMGALY